MKDGRNVSHKRQLKMSLGRQAPSHRLKAASSSEDVRILCCTVELLKGIGRARYTGSIPAFMSPSRHECEMKFLDYYTYMSQSTN